MYEMKTALVYAAGAVCLLPNVWTALEIQRNLIRPGVPILAALCIVLSVIRLLSIYVPVWLGTLVCFACSQVFYILTVMLSNNTFADKAALLTGLGLFRIVWTDKFSWCFNY